MSTSAETSPSKGIALFVAGGILLLLGSAGIVAYSFGLTDHVEAPGQVIGMLRGATIVGAGLATALGAALVVLGIVKRRARSRA